MNKIYLILPILLSINISYAYPMTLPIINQADFKACFLGFCQTVSPNLLLTDMGLINANNSLYLNGEPSTYYLNNTFNTSIFLTNETEPMFNYNWSNISSWLYNQTIPALSFGVNTFYNISNPFGYYNSTTLPADTDAIIDTQTCAYGVASINNVTGVVTCDSYFSNANVSTTSCSSGQLVSEVSNSTGVVSCTADLFNTTSQIQTAVNNTNAIYNMTFSNMTLNTSGFIKIYNSTGVASCISANATYSFMIFSTC